MAGLLDGLESLGLGKLENIDIFADQKAAKKKTGTPEKKAEPEFSAPTEEEFIYDREFECPVCGSKFTAKVMKTNKARLLATDPDLRPRYEYIDPNKYDVLLCNICGYAALARYHGTLLPTQVKLIKENISMNVRLNKYPNSTYSYDEAIERFKLALANAVVKRCKLSERAYICLKLAWVIRGKREELAEQNKLPQDVRETLELQEKEYLKNAYAGLLEARSKETPPIAGMDSTTLDYLLAQLAFSFGDYSASSKIVSGILSNRGGNDRVKKKALELKEALMSVKES